MAETLKLTPRECLGALLSEFDDVFRLAGPRPVVKGAVGVLGALGHARGYKREPGRPGSPAREAHERSVLTFC